MRKIRRALSNSTNYDIAETIINTLAKTKSNQNFVSIVNDNRISF